MADSAWTRLPRALADLSGVEEFRFRVGWDGHDCDDYLLWRGSLERRGRYDVFDSEFEERLYEQRLEKLKEIGRLGQAQGLTEAEATYPSKFEAADGMRLWTVPEVRAEYIETEKPATAEELEANRVEVWVAGRVMQIRVQGKAGFAQLQQGGQRLQIYVRKDEVGEEQFGDLQAAGPGRSHRGDGIPVCDEDWRDDGACEVAAVSGEGAAGAAG